MGGPHDCQQFSEDVPRLQVMLPDPPMRGVCGNFLRGRMNQQIILEGNHFTHLKRFFERVQDAADVADLFVAGRAGSLQFFGTPGMYSAEVGNSDA